MDEEIVKAKVQHFIMYAVNDSNKYKVGSEFGHGLGVVLRNSYSNVEIMLLMPTTITVPVNMIILANKLTPREMFDRFNDLFERFPTTRDFWDDLFAKRFPPQ